MANGAAVLILPSYLLGISAPNTPIAGDGTADLTLPVIGLQASDYTAALPTITLSADGIGGTTTDGTNITKKLPALTLAANGLTEVTGNASITLPILSLSAHSVSYAELTTPKYSASGNSLTGTAATSGKQIPSLLLDASGKVENLGTASLTSKALVLVATGSGGTAGSLSRTLAKFGISADGLHGNDASSDSDLPGFTLATEGFAPSLGTATLSLQALSLLAAGGSSSNTDSYSAFTLNTNTQSMTSYTNFPFNSFAMFNGTALAAGDSGIYALTGTVDDAAEITSTVELGMFDFESEQLKRVHELYFGYRSNGDLTVTVTLDDNESYTYILPSTGQDGLYNNRLKMGRGMKARFWQIQVEGVGVDWELASISTEPIQLSRRL